MRVQALLIAGTSRVRRQDGMALITVMMVMMLVSVLMVGFVAAIVADNRGSGLDRDQTQAYAAAHAGLEKLTSDLSTLFTLDFAPGNVQINALNAAPPVVTGFSYLAPDGTPGYLITFIPDALGNPAPMDIAGTAISAGPYQGLKGIITPYDITVTARSTGGAEVRMRRTLQTIQVPVFQFGVFSEGDLSVYADADATITGRVHTNGDLYLSSGDGKVLTLTDRVTAVGEIIRSNLSNGFPTATDHKGKVMVLKSTNSYRDLDRKEGSLVGDLGTNLNEPTWTTLSIGTYNGNIRNGRTGARTLVLPLVDQGARPIDIIRRPAQGSNEHVGPSRAVYNQRFYAQASLRILLSDTAADISTLPLATATAPVPLDGTATVAQYDRSPPLAVSAGPGSTTTTGVTNPGVNVTIPIVDVRPLLPTLRVGATTVVCSGRNAALTQFTGCVGTPISVNGTSVTGGAMSTVTNNPTVWNAATIDVANNAAFAPLPFFWGDNITGCTIYTATLLMNGNGVSAATGNLPNNAVLTTAALSTAGQPMINGFIKIEMQTAPDVWVDVTTEVLNLGIGAPNQSGFLCNDPSPDAIVRVQRLRDNGSLTACGIAGRATDYWPNALYDTREANLRDESATVKGIALGGVMNYISFDVNNYRRWLTGAIVGTGNLSYQKDGGYIVYFSDRRNDRNAANVETGEYGWEDNINPGNNNGALNGVLDPADGLFPLEGGGEDSNGNGVFNMDGAIPKNLPAGAALPYTAAARPQLAVVTAVPITAPHAMVNRQILFRRALKLVNGGSGNLPVGLTVASENPVYVQGNYNALAAAAAADPHVPASILADAVTLLSNSWADVQSFRHPNDPDQRVASNTGYRFAMVSGKGPAFEQPAGWGAMRDFGTDGGAQNYLRLLESWDNRTMSYRGSIISFFTSRQATSSFKCCETVYEEPIRNIIFDTEFLSPNMLPPGTPSFRDVNTLTFRQLLRPNQ
jgi:type II secretory pathway pseudopilin PulG